MYPEPKKPAGVVGGVCDDAVVAYDEAVATRVREWQANIRGDGAFYDRMLTEDALLVSRFGVAGKAHIVPLIQANENPFSSAELSGQKVLRLTDNSALVTYKVFYTSPAGDQTALATSVYVRRDGRWRSASHLHQQTNL